MTQNNKSKMKGGLWFIIIPILVILAISSKYMIFNNYLKLSPSFPTKFTPEELSNIIRNFSSDNIAGTCISKDFVEYEDEKWNYRYLSNNIYSYYYFGKKIDQSNQEAYKAEYQEGLEKRYANMRERIIPIDSLDCIYYTIKNQDNFIEYIGYLKKINQDTSTNAQNIGLKYYVVNNAVFLDCGFKKDFKGYCLCIFSLNKLKDIFDYANNGIRENVFTGMLAMKMANGEREAFKTAALLTFLYNAKIIKNN